MTKKDRELLDGLTYFTDGDESFLENPDNEALIGQHIDKLLQNAAEGCEILNLKYDDEIVTVLIKNIQLTANGALDVSFISTNRDYPEEKIAEDVKNAIMAIADNIKHETFFGKIKNKLRGKK